MIKLKQLLFESGAEAGSVEVANTPLKKARTQVELILSKVGKSLELELPNFDSNYQRIYNLFKMGKTKRSDMPAIDSRDTRLFQQRLSQGYIDIKKPLAPSTNIKNPFPLGLTGKQAEEWLEAGLERNDGDANDDKIKVKDGRTEVGNLKPIQKQVYLDKSMTRIAQGSAAISRSYLERSIYIVSSDHYIIDGHHRYLTAMLIDPTMKVNIIAIDLPLKQLLAVSTAYGDAIGNARNA